MDGLHFTLHAFNMNVATSNFEVVSRPFAQLSISSRSHAGVATRSAPAFCSAHPREQHRETAIIICEHHTRAIQHFINGNDPRGDACRWANQSKQTFVVCATTHKQRKQKHDKEMDFSVEIMITILQIVLAWKAHIAAYGTKNECSQGVENILKDSKEFWEPINGKSVPDRCKKLRIQFRVVEKRNAVWLGVDVEVCEKHELHSMKVKVCDESRWHRAKLRDKIKKWEAPKLAAGSSTLSKPTAVIAKRLNKKAVQNLAEKMSLKAVHVEKRSVSYWIMPVRSRVRWLASQNRWAITILLKSLSERKE